MRESTSTYPLQNRACLSITPHMYDRRALDVKSALPLLNNLTGLTFLTSTSPRIRDIMTQDGGLERLLDIMRESCKERTTPLSADLWGLNGPTTAKVLGIDRQNALKHSLAFQCVVNIGVRGSEQVRTRVVQSGALDLVAHILEQWMEKRNIYVHPHSLGSIQAVKLFHQGGPLPTRSSVARIIQPQPVRRPAGATDAASTFTALESEPPFTVRAQPVPVEMMQVEPTVPTPEPTAPVEAPLPGPPMPEAVAADVDMDDSEIEDPAIQSAGEDAAPMDVDPPAATNPPDAAMIEATPRATGSRLPNNPAGALDIPIRPTEREDQGQLSSGANSLTGSEDDRGVSDNEMPDARGARQRPSALNLRVPGLAAGGASNQSSPMGTPTRMEPGELMRNIVRRDTITARTVQVEQLTRGLVAQDTAGTEAINTENPQLDREVLAEGIAAVIRTDAMEFDEQVEPPEVAIVEIEQGVAPEEPDPEVMAAEQARLDLEAGAPPGQPGANVITPPAAADGPIEGVIAADPDQPTVVNIEPVIFPGLRPAPTGVGNPGAQVIIANGAPRGFHELAAYVGISNIIHPKGDRFSDDSVLLCLQLLAYLSKYPHVRTAFHHPHLPMHRTFEYGQNDELPERPHISATRNMFSLVERFCFRASVGDSTMFRVPSEIQYWAGVIMRNACRKDDLQSGIRQCAHMNCGKWETFAREFAKCRRCRKAKYCSKACQSAAWSEGHRFWCSPRPDADAPPDPNAPVAPAAPVAPVFRRPELLTAEGRLGLNFWELAITLAMEGPSHVTLLRLLADSPVPEGHQLEPIVRWILQELVPYLLSRPEDQEAILWEINRDPQVPQNLFRLFAGDPEMLAQGIQMLLMESRMQAQIEREARLDEAFAAGEDIRQTPPGIRPRGARPPVVETVLNPNQTPERREARLADRFAAELDQRVRRAARGTQTAQVAEAGPPANAAPPRRVTQTNQPLARAPLALGNWLPDLPAAFRPAPHAAVDPPAPTLAPAADVAFLQGQPRLPLFGRPEVAVPSPFRNDRTPANTRGFSLTEVWRNMAGGRRDNNNNNGNAQANPNPEDNQAGNA